MWIPSASISQTQIRKHEASQSPNPQAAWGEQKPQPQAHFNPTDELAEAPVQATRGEQKPQPQGQAMPLAQEMKCLR